MTKKVIEVEAVVVQTFGKFEYNYKPTENKVESLLEMMNAMHKKPETQAKRTAFSHAMAKQAVILLATNDIELEFKVIKVTQPSMPKELKAGDTLFQDTEIAVLAPKMDLSFLG